MVATVTKEKWAKLQSMVRELLQLLLAGPMPHKRLEKIRGFLIYMARTYRWMTPYLKSLHLVIDSWRPGRDAESGWSHKYLYKDEDGDWILGSGSGGEAEGAPDVIEPSGDLREMFEFQVRMLIKLLSGEAPAEQFCRAEGTVTAMYLWGDASGASFGSLIHEKEIEYEAAEWAGDHQEESSNWREANNLTTREEVMGRQGRLHRRELIIVTDNDTFEKAYYKGHSKSPKLNSIIFRLHQIARVTGAIIHVIHVAGTRMKEAGVDGLSRGDFLQGIMAGNHPLEYLPLNEDANFRAGGAVKEWADSWWGRGGTKGSVNEKPLKLLSPEDWFTLYENEEPRLWCPPPAAMETVVELFNDDRLAHPKIPHVFCVPRLMTHLWRKALEKDADLVFRVDAGAPFWPKSMHEPLNILVVLPLSFTPNYRGPWVMRGSDRSNDYRAALDTHYRRARGDETGKLHVMEGPLPDLRGGTATEPRDILRKFLAEAGSVQAMPVRLPRGVLQTAPERQIPRAKRTRR